MLKQSTQKYCQRRLEGQLWGIRRLGNSQTQVVSAIAAYLIIAALLPNEYKFTREIVT
jgi:hypothetical protein